MDFKKNVEDICSGSNVGSRVSVCGEIVVDIGDLECFMFDNEESSYQIKVDYENIHEKLIEITSGLTGSRYLTRVLGIIEGTLSKSEVDYYKYALKDISKLTVKYEGAEVEVDL
jgi:hypothetical protein